MSREERCANCDDPTGRAGRGDDSLYVQRIDGREIGPLCPDCYFRERCDAQEEEIGDLQAEVTMLKEIEQARHEPFNAEAESTTILHALMSQCDTPEGMALIRYTLHVEVLLDDLRQQLAAATARAEQAEANLAIAGQVITETADAFGQYGLVVSYDNEAILVAIQALGERAEQAERERDEWIEKRAEARKNYWDVVEKLDAMQAVVDAAKALRDSDIALQIRPATSGKLLALCYAIDAMEGGGK